MDSRVRTIIVNQHTSAANIDVTALRTTNCRLKGPDKDVEETATTRLIYLPTDGCAGCARGLKVAKELGRDGLLLRKHPYHGREVENIRDKNTTVLDNCAQTLCISVESLELHLPEKWAGGLLGRKCLAVIANLCPSPVQGIDMRMRYGHVAQLSCPML